MKKILIIILLTAVSPLYAQLKNMNQLVTFSTESYNQLENYLKKNSMIAQETGKMDSLTYTRWLPKEINSTNMGNCYMIFYKSKSKPINYIVYQTINKDTFQKYMAEIKKIGFQFASDDKKQDKQTEYYAKGKYGLSVITGKEKPADPVMYIFGIRILPNDGKQKKPVAVQPVKK